jgi:hypothetical protein
VTANDPDPARPGRKRRERPSLQEEFEREVRAALATISRQRHESNKSEYEVYRQLRRSRLTWTQIAAITGYSAQGAQQRFARLEASVADKSQ